MAEFTYIARDRNGQVVHGTVQALNSALAAGKLQEMGYQVERVRAADDAAGPRRGVKESLVYPVHSGVSLPHLAQFYRQFATLIHAGIPLFNALATLRTQTTSGRLRDVIGQMERQVQNGGPLSDVMARYPWIFGGLQLEMIRAAERGGMLEDNLRRVADYLDQELALRRLISRLTLYPKLVLFAAWFLLGSRFFADAQPAIAKLVVGGMGGAHYTGLDYLQETAGALAVVALIVFGIVAFCRIVLFQSDAMAEGYERMKRAIPGLGRVSQGFALAKFGRAFGAMYSAGMPMSSAIRLAGSASGSRVLLRATERAAAAASEGATVSQAFAASGAFPPMVISMLNTGEQTGNVDSMMTKVAEYLEGESEQKAHLYSNIFAVVVLLLVGLAVAVAVVEFYMRGPMASIQSQMND